MGGTQSNSILNATDIQQTQISETNQKCTTTDVSSLSDVQITIINSTVGDISLTNSLKIGSLSCVLNALIQNSASNIVDNINKNTNSTNYPISFTNQANSVANINNIYSFQQALINQTCNQSVIAETNNVTLTIIDSVTGNIVIANSAQIESQSCNLAATTYQQVVNQAVNDTKNENSAECALFDFCLIIPILAAIVAIPILSRFASSALGGARPGGSGGDDREQRQYYAAQAGLAQAKAEQVTLQALRESRAAAPSAAGAAGGKKSKIE